MPPTSPPQNAGQSNAWSSTQETEATHVSAGYRDALTFDLVPRTSIRFDPPDPAAVQKLRSPGELFIEVPIKGKAVNFEPGVTLDCELSWLVQQGTGAPRACPVGGAKLVIAQNGTFQVQVGGKAPVVDLVTHRLINAGLLGYSITPKFPHAEPAELAPVIRFNNPCSLTVKKPEGAAIKVGELVTFSPSFSTVLRKAQLELRVIELDEGSSEVVSGAGLHAFTHRWEPTGFWMFRPTGVVPWAIGFSDDTCEHFADVGDQEEGGYEYGWQLWGRSASDKPQTLLLEDKDFLKLPKPQLEELKVEYDRSWEGTWEVHGKITGVAPRAGLMLEVAVIEPPASAAPTQSTPLVVPRPVVPPALGAQPGAANTSTARRTPSVRVQLGADGIFEAHVGERHWSSPVNPNVSFVAPKGYAIVSLVATAQEGKPGPLSPYLDFDENTFSLFTADALTWDPAAEWICSEEATSLVTRPPKPKRRKSGLTTSPAPGPEVGDQKTAITFEEMWLDIIAWEGVVPYMYLDTKGYVTVGAGNLLQRIDPASEGDKLAAKTHPFQNMDAGRAASATEITEAYNKVKTLAAGLPATEYALRPKIALTDVYIKQLAQERYEKEFLASAKRGFPDFESYPRAARRGILDVMYNAGASVPTTWTKLATAVKARNWTVASTECRTKPQNKEDTRNEWRKALFLYAAKVDKRPGS